MPAKKAQAKKVAPKKAISPKVRRERSQAQIDEEFLGKLPPLQSAEHEQTRATLMKVAYQHLNMLAHLIGAEITLLQVKQAYELALCRTEDWEWCAVDPLRFVLNSVPVSDRSGLRELLWPSKAAKEWIERNAMWSSLGEVVYNPLEIMWHLAYLGIEKHSALLANMTDTMQDRMDDDKKAKMLTASCQGVTMTWWRGSKVIHVDVDSEEN